ncbi:hypothetical protein [Taibaiella soli]|uniref:Outer membrane protein beta-barrel domain-containing protein n=1 Tax=Taibaiella soli TaxID=1649169 RepID=A0A2W2B2A0_9BACT|nr:hypothetical protein [Taibaiella soli]PZF74394.1 hypothetical protein DN068_02100 [Taibaiella soli]
MSIPTKELLTLLIALGCNTAFAQQQVPDQDPESNTTSTALVFSQKTPVHKNTLSYSHTDMNGYSGPGLNYDRIIDRSGKWAINATVGIGYRNNDASKNFQVAPFKGVCFLIAGVRYELTKPTSRWHYSVMAALAAGKGQPMSSWSHDTQSEANGIESTTYTFHPYSMFGAMFTQSVSFDITKRLQVGGDLGIGHFFSEQSYNQPTHSKIMLQGSFRIGFKF